MPETGRDFQVVSLPKTRQAIGDMLHEGQQKHMIHGLTEVDVTRPRQLIAQHKEASRETLSFSAFRAAFAAALAAGARLARAAMSASTLGSVSPTE